MSELKSYKLFHRASALTSPEFLSVVEFGNGDEVYTKSEADKVIAEKAKEIARLDDLAHAHNIELLRKENLIAELKNRIAPKKSDKTLQERLNEVCKKHAVSTLQDLDWAFCMTEARLEDYAKLAAQLVAQKNEALEKMLQYDKEHCRDLNTQERRFALQMAHHKYKRCLAMANWCKDMSVWWNDEQVLRLNEQTGNAKSRRFQEAHKKFVFFFKWHKRWLELAEKFKELKND